MTDSLKSAAEILEAVGKDGLILALRRGGVVDKETLSGVDLSGANLAGVNLIRANLSGTDLSGTNLRRAHLFGTNLREANLLRADLSGADLSGADLTDARLGDPDNPNQGAIVGCEIDPISGRPSAAGRTTSFRNANLDGAILFVKISGHPPDIWRGARLTDRTQQPTC